MVSQRAARCQLMRILYILETVGTSGPVIGPDGRRLLPSSAHARVAPRGAMPSGGEGSGRGRPCRDIHHQVPGVRTTAPVLDRPLAPSPDKAPRAGTMPHRFDTIERTAGL